MKSAVLLLCGLILLGAAEVADPTEARLCHTSMFAFGGVGFVPKRTQGEVDFDDIRCRAFALSDFERVFANGSPEAKAYALVAIHKLSPEKFKALADPLRTSTEKVNAGMGCVIYGRTMGQLISAIEAGRFAKN